MRPPSSSFARHAGSAHKTGRPPFCHCRILILNCLRKRSSNLRISDRIVAGLCALLIRPSRLVRFSIVLRPSPLLSCHRALKERKYHPFAPRLRKKPSPKGPAKEVITAVVEMKQRNLAWGCPQIAQPIALAFDIPINKDAVRRILAAHYQPRPDTSGLSWLAFIGPMKDSLWSIDRCD